MLSPHEALQSAQPFPSTSLDLDRPSPAHIASSLSDRILTPPHSLPPYWLPLWQPHWISGISAAVPPLQDLLCLKRSHSRTVFCWRWAGLDGPVSISSEVTILCSNSHSFPVLLKCCILSYQLISLFIFSQSVDFITTDLLCDFCKSIYITITAFRPS